MERAVVSRGYRGLMALLLDLVVLGLAIGVVGLGGFVAYAETAVTRRLRVWTHELRLRWGLRRLGWTSAVVDATPGFGEPEHVLVRTFPAGRVVLRPGPSGGFLDGELGVGELPAWLRVTADADREPGVAVGAIHLPPALMMPDDLVTRVVVALENGGWIDGGRMVVAVGNNLLPVQLEVEAQRLMATATGLRALPDGRVEGVDRLWREPRYRGRAAAAQWLLDNRPERRDALLAELLLRPEPGLRLIAAVAIPRVDVLEALIRDTDAGPVLAQAVPALARLARPRLGPLLSGRIRAQAEPWGTLIAAVRSYPDPDPVKALGDVVAGSGFLLDPADTVAVLAECSGTWERALGARVRQAPDAGLHTEVLEVIKERGLEMTLTALVDRLQQAPGPRLAWQLDDAVVAIRRRLGLTQDGQVALVEGGGQLAVAGDSGGLGLATEDHVGHEPVPRVVRKLGDGIGIE